MFFSPLQKAVLLGGGSLCRLPTKKEHLGVNKTSHPYTRRGSSGDWSLLQEVTAQRQSKRVVLAGVLHRSERNTQRTTKFKYKYTFLQYLDNICLQSWFVKRRQKKYLFNLLHFWGKNQAYAQLHLFFLFFTTFINQHTNICTLNTRSVLLLNTIILITHRNLFNLFYLFPLYSSCIYL